MSPGLAGVCTVLSPVRMKFSTVCVSRELGPLFLALRAPSGPPPRASDPLSWPGLAPFLASWRRWVSLLLTTHSAAAPGPYRLTQNSQAGRMERDKDAAAQLLGRQSYHLLPALRINPSLFPREATNRHLNPPWGFTSTHTPTLLLFWGCSSPTTQSQGWSSARGWCHMEKGTESRWGVRDLGGLEGLRMRAVCGF